MSKRPASEGPPGVEATKVARVEGAPGIVSGVVRKTGPRLPVIMYKEGEPLHELAQYLTADNGQAQAVEVRIPAHALISSNRQVRSRQLWGSDVYTSDSDLVAVLMHYGYVFHTITQAIRDVAEVRAVVRPSPARAAYPSTPRNSIRSRAWNATISGCSFSVEKAWVVTRTGNSYDLKPSVEGVPAAAATFAPTHFERIVTRSTAGPASRQRHVQEVTAVFNLANEPWPKYTPATVCDRGLKPHDWTSARLHTHVLYAESHTERFELCRMEGDGGERFKWSRCAKPLGSRAMRTTGVPLPASEKTVLAEGVQWEEFVWGPTAVKIRDEKYSLIRIHFMPIEAMQAGSAEEGGEQ